MFLYLFWFSLVLNWAFFNKQFQTSRPARRSSVGAGSNNTATKQQQAADQQQQQQQEARAGELSMVSIDTIDAYQYSSTNNES